MGELAPIGMLLAAVTTLSAVIGIMWASLTARIKASDERCAAEAARCDAERAELLRLIDSRFGALSKH